MKLKESQNFKENFSIFLIILLIISLIITSVIFFNKSENYRTIILYQYKSVPSIDLVYNFPTVIRGFVKFDNKNKQPNNIRQYYIIKELNQEDTQGLPMFSIEEILKLDALPPTSTGIEILHITNIINEETIVLEDKNKNQYFINVKKGIVTGIDAGGDKTTLITSNFAYREFIRLLLK